MCSRSPGGRVGRCCPADRNDSWGGRSSHPVGCKLSHATGLACGRDGSTKLPSRCTPFLESSLFCVSSLFSRPPFVCSCRSSLRPTSLDLQQTFVSLFAVVLGRQQDGVLEWRLLWVFLFIRRFLRFTNRAGLLKRPRKEGRTDGRTDARTRPRLLLWSFILLVAPFFVLWFWGVFFLPSFPGPPFHGSRWPTRDTCKWTASGCHGAHFYRRSHGDGLHQDQGA